MIRAEGVADDGCSLSEFGNELVPVGRKDREVSIIHIGDLSHDERFGWERAVEDAAQVRV